MILQAVLELRGTMQTKSSNGDKIYNFINAEDIYGESAKLYCDCPIGNLKKGCKYLATIDYSSKYGSLKVVNLEERK